MHPQPLGDWLLFWLFRQPICSPCRSRWGPRRLATTTAAPDAEEEGGEASRHHLTSRETPSPPRSPTNESRTIFRRSVRMGGASRVPAHGQKQPEERKPRERRIQNPPPAAVPLASVVRGRGDGHHIGARVL
ncbi:hypothetical protein HPB50_007275 [Hyalomma asiaticum]|uniref:Uncharacterized protein n=1 Tax=Hyalomma asiaticum TaxID=266040 RepID=A0ACB7RQU0_HYAAI|nr:hypothetical protein HPB50_007275 [Hyalomma asiaticum]